MCLCDYACRTNQDQAKDSGAMLRKIDLSPTRRVLMASLTMYSCFHSSRYLSGPHGSAFCIQIVLLIVGKFICFELGIGWSMDKK